MKMRVSFEHSPEKQLKMRLLAKITVLKLTRTGYQTGKKATDSQIFDL